MPSFKAKKHFNHCLFLKLSFVISVRLGFTLSLTAATHLSDLVREIPTVYVHVSSKGHARAEQLLIKLFKVLVKRLVTSLIVFSSG